MSDLSTAVDSYLAVWNEKDPDARRAAIDKVWSEQGRYVDPLADVTGRDGVEEVIATAQDQFAGLNFARGESFDTHHDVARFTWHLVAPGSSEPIAIGFDVLSLDESGQVKAVYGFIDKMPAAG